MQKKFAPTHPHKLISLTSHSSQLLATLRSECSIPPPECFEIDPTDTTQEVKKVTITETGPAQPMEQVNPHHLGTCVHYTCRQSSQPSTTTHAVSTHIILQMESTVTSHKT